MRFFRLALVTLLVLLILPGVVAADVELTPGQYQSKQLPLSEFELKRYQYCGSDRDCVAARNGCCDCANGGEDVAINRNQLRDFQERFDCLNVVCTQIESVPACGSGVVSCVNHRCKYFNLSDL